ncbi:hypothetical protein PYW07_005846 [Mythimna separata]|uniref:Uncharacterized protein n=1 Tax=Mythimna separata TaxID=271217 RepID=A0AAD8DRP1_MYTSE|nr:hypothetical protein PYW07_005846 [Mythimna separata]
MASKLIVLLSLALLSCAFAAPAPTAEQPAETTAAADEEDVPVLEVIEVIEDVPVLVGVVNGNRTSEPATKEPAHKVAKRSALRGDNPSNDLLANADGFAFDNAEFGVGGRRIKFLPTWAG